MESQWRIHHNVTQNLEGFFFIRMPTIVIFIGSSCYWHKKYIFHSKNKGHTLHVMEPTRWQTGVRRQALGQR